MSNVASQVVFCGHATTWASMRALNCPNVCRHVSTRSQLVYGAINNVEALIDGYAVACMPQNCPNVSRTLCRQGPLPISCLNAGPHARTAYV
eukprot:353787-Chlamydomonas_euryale.AAC.1